MANFSAANFLNGSTSQEVSKFPCALQGVFVSTATGATVALFDATGTSANNPIISAFVPNASICWYPMPVQTRNGLNISVAGTITYTVFWD